MRILDNVVPGIEVFWHFGSVDQDTHGRGQKGPRIPRKFVENSQLRSLKFE